MKKKTILIVVLIVAIVLCLLFMRETVVWKEQPLFAMDTYCTLKIKGQDSTMEKLMQCIETADASLNAYDKNSKVYALNSAGKSTDAELKALTEKLLSYNKNTDGAFDFSMKKLSDQWGFETENPKVPEAIDFTAFGADKVEIYQDEILLDGVEVDFGGVAKGYVTDKLVQILEEDNVKDALLDLGGNIYAKGTYTIGIKNPQEGENLACSVEVTDKAVITSGVYQRYFKDKDGNRWHHILNPETGFPTDNGVLSVTVIGDKGIECDVLSTAFLVAGVDKTFEMCKNFDVEVILVTKDTVYYTPGIAKKIQKNNSFYQFKAAF